MMKKHLLLAGTLALGASISAQEKPNIIIILADDLGFSDLGCFGGEIHIFFLMSAQKIVRIHLYQFSQ